MNITKFKQTKVVKNKHLSKDTTITIKTSHDIRNQWNIYCLQNNINQRKTLENFLVELIKDN